MSPGFSPKSPTAKKQKAKKKKSLPVAKIEEIQQSLVQHFSSLEDHRVDRTKKHQLMTGLQGNRPFMG